MIKDIPLIGFTIFCQLSVGVLLLYNFIVFLPSFRNKTHFPAHFKTIPTIALGFALVAVFISIFHLGKPFKALYTLDNLASSWLSREILMIIVYVFFTTLFTVFILTMSDWKRVIMVFLNTATISGVILIFLKKN